jgi:putative hydrolase of the HAD superfamily
MQSVKNIIFDLGGVILNLDFKKTELAFAALGIGNFNEYYTLQTVTPIFEKLEIGEITPETFYDEFRKLVRLPLTDEQISTAWNALLIDFPPERINWLKEIKNRYNIYLLSNTNEIHYNSFSKTFKEQINSGSLDELFIKTYYSHQMGLRKPSKEIFEAILREEGLDMHRNSFYR